MQGVPMDVITAGADDGAQKVAEFVRDQMTVEAPWHTGTLANSHIVTKPSLSRLQQERDVIATRRVMADKRRVQNASGRGWYYPLPVHFGWHPSAETFVQPDPWMYRALDYARGPALGIYRNELRRKLLAANQGGTP